MILGEKYVIGALHWKRLAKQHASQWRFFYTSDQYKAQDKGAKEHGDIFSELSDAQYSTDIEQHDNDQQMAYVDT